MAREADGKSGKDLYGENYFGSGRDPGSRQGRSGYERYSRKSSRADVSAYLIWRHFEARQTLDVGCALGFVVEALLEVGADAYGVDVSAYAVQGAPPALRGRLFQADLTGRLPFNDASFDLISAFEVLEHLPPETLPGVLAELRRITRRYVFATIPSLGENAFGPAGWFEGKVRPERLEHYRALGPGYDGPIPFEDLMRDAEGNPIEGHLTIASFRWWTQRFAEVGLVRTGEVERRIYLDLERFGRTGLWCPYAFQLPEHPEPQQPRRSAEEIARVEALWKLRTVEAMARMKRNAMRLLGPVYPLARSVLLRGVAIARQARDAVTRMLPARRR